MLNWFCQIVGNSLSTKKYDTPTLKEVLHGTAYFDDDRLFECCIIIPSRCWVKEVSQDDLDADVE